MSNLLYVACVIFNYFFSFTLVSQLASIYGPFCFFKRVVRKTFYLMNLTRLTSVYHLIRILLSSLFSCTSVSTFKVLLPHSFEQKLDERNHTWIDIFELGQFVNNLSCLAAWALSQSLRVSIFCRFPWQTEVNYTWMLFSMLPVIGKFENRFRAPRSPPTED